MTVVVALAVVVLAALVLALLGVVIALLVHLGAPVFQPRCTVGVYGADATVTVRGVGAQSVCDRIAATVDASGAHGWYARDEDPGGTLMCTLSQDGVTVYVRDRGMLHLIGTSLCQSLEQEGMAPTS